MRLPFGFHMLGSQFGFGLRFKDRILHLDAEGSNQRCPDIIGIKILFVKLPDGLHQRFAECSLVGSTLGGMLAIDKGIILFTIHLTMGESKFKIAVFQVDDRIKDRGINIAVQQVEQPILRMEPFTVENDGQSVVQKDIVPEHLSDIFRDKMVFPEDLLIGNKGDDGSLPELSRLFTFIVG